VLIGKYRHLGYKVDVKYSWGQVRKYFDFK
jgi:hypothetical protein